ncbi:MAG TPA: homoserine dehydrogenase, partial [Xanthobacteraceae bacterium]|nr:homoserine dehydrogenase [Xanthobacteraceae bacterium]
MVAPLKVGLAGLGTVGTSVVRLIERQREALEARCGRPIQVVAVTARSRSKRRDIDISRFRWAADAVALAGDPEIDVFVEVIGGESDPAKRAVEAALAAGKSVVTANKALLARHGVALAALAEQHHVALNFEAAVAGGIPIVKTLREGLVGNSLTRIYGILNGTCNYILTRMEQDNLSFAHSLEEAQRLGYAEANPSFDIEGHDTAQKLAILASLAFGTRVDPGAVYVEGIASITPEDLRAAADLGYRVKLLGVAVKTENGIEQRVHPTMVPKGSAIAQVMGVTNAVTVDADAVREITLVGPGAGGEATASAVVSDIADIARGVRTAPFGRPSARLAGVEKAPMQRHEGGYYIRMLAVDKPGTAARIATCFAEESISLESIMQRHFGPRPLGGEDPSAARPVPVILITYATTEDAVRRALAKVEAERVIE